MTYGTAAVDVIQSSTTGTPTQFQDGSGTQIGTLCRAWVNFVGSSATINASFNVSSVTRSAAGNYTVNFTTALVDTKYAVCSVASNGGTNSGNWTTSGTPLLQTYLTGSKSTTSINLINNYCTGGYAFDNQEAGVAIFR